MAYDKTGFAMAGNASRICPAKAADAQGRDTPDGRVRAFERVFACFG